MEEEKDPLDTQDVEPIETTAEPLAEETPAADPLAEQPEPEAQ